MSRAARLGIKVCRNIKCMKRESQGCAVRETLLPPTRICTCVHVQKRLPSTHLPHLKADGTRLAHTHVRVRLVHIVPRDLATIKSQRRVDNGQSENFMQDTSCKNNYTPSLATRFQLYPPSDSLRFSRHIPQRMNFNAIVKQISSATLSVTDSFYSCTIYQFSKHLSIINERANTV